MQEMAHYLYSNNSATSKVYRQDRGFAVYLCNGQGDIIEGSEKVYDNLQNALNACDAIGDMIESKAKHLTEDYWRAKDEHGVLYARQVVLSEIEEYLGDLESDMEADLFECDRPYLVATISYLHTFLDSLYKCPTGECYRACELHGLTYCGICHVHEDECDYGGCLTPATHKIARTREGNTEIVEYRHMCGKHAALYHSRSNHFIA